MFNFIGEDANFKNAMKFQIFQKFVDITIGNFNIQTGHK